MIVETKGEPSYKSLMGRSKDWLATKILQLLQDMSIICEKHDIELQELKSWKRHVEVYHKLAAIEADKYIADQKKKHLDQLARIGQELDI